MLPWKEVPPSQYAVARELDAIIRAVPLGFDEHDLNSEKWFEVM